MRHPPESHDLPPDPPAEPWPDTPPDLPAGLPVDLPAGLAEALDRAGYLVGHDAPARRSAGLRLAREAAARARQEGPEVQARVEAEVVEIEARARDSARRLKGRLAELGRESAGGLVFALLSLALLQVMWDREWQTPELPAVFERTAPPQRTAHWVTVVAPGTGEGAPGADHGPEALDGEAAAPPEPEEAGEEQAPEPEVVAPPEPLEPAPGEPEAPPSTVPAEATSPPPPPAQDGPAPENDPSERTLSRLISQVGPKSDTSKPAASAPPDARTAPDGPEAVAVVAPAPGSGTSRTRPRPQGPLPPLVLPDLPEGGGEGIVALARDAPLDFIAIGPQAAEPARRKGTRGLEIARTEVTQAQWAVIMHLDLSSISGQWELPAEAMSWCEAVRFANALSEREGLERPYEVGRDCERGGEVRWDTRAEGFRLLTEAEWVALAKAEGRPEQLKLPLGVERLNNRGIHTVEAGDDQQAHGVRGIDDNAREWIWGRAPLPDGGAPDGERVQVHLDAYSRAVVMGCPSVTPEDLAAAMIGAELPEHRATLEWCREAPRAAEVPLGVGLRLARGSLAGS